MSFDTFRQFSIQKHAKYFLGCLNRLPSSVTSEENSRMLLLFFSISGLDILNALDTISDSRKKEIVDWIYHLQLVPDENDDDSVERWGFVGSSSIILQKGFPGPDFSRNYAFGHLSMTYVALATLIILGDNLSKVDVHSIMRGMRACQREDGSFCGTLADSNDLDVRSNNHDMRFVYSAAAICYFLQDWSGMDIPLTTNFIMKSLSYDYGFSQKPFLESHGGFTYCAVSSLALMGSLNTSLTSKQMDGLRRWCILRQYDGFQGRPNKSTDTCYAFWIGATLKMIDALHLSNLKESRSFLMFTQDSLGYGFAKQTGVKPDPLHSYFGIAGLSLMNEEGLSSIDPRLNITQRAATHLHRIHLEKVKKQDEKER